MIRLKDGRNEHARRPHPGRRATCVEWRAGAERYSVIGRMFAHNRLKRLRPTSSDAHAAHHPRARREGCGSACIPGGTRDDFHSSDLPPVPLAVAGACAPRRKNPSRAGDPATATGDACCAGTSGTRATLQSRSRNRIIRFSRACSHELTVDRAQASMSNDLSICEL